MKTFIKKISLFFSILLGIVLTTYFVLNYANKKAFENFKTAPNVKNLFVGDSHVQYSINDQLLSNALNLSQDSESYFYSFYKLLGVLKNNPSIKKLYLGVGYHSFSSYYDDYVIGDFSKDIAARYFFILPPKERLFFFKVNSSKKGIFINRIFKSSFKTLFTKPSNFSFLGGYQNNFVESSASLKSIDNRIKQQFFLGDSTRNFSDTNIHYFNKIIELSAALNVEVVLLNSPLHPYYKSNIPKKFLDKYDDLVRGTGLKVIDFSEFSLNDSCFIPDGDHVSKRGAIITTNYLKNLP